MRGIMLPAWRINETYLCPRVHELKVFRFFAAFK
jgi:hypothetical protein